MGERGRPRDVYDIITLFRRDDLHGERRLIVSVLQEKCRTKGVAVPTLAAIEQAETRAELASEWENMLGHQLPAIHSAIAGEADSSSICGSNDAVSSKAAARAGQDTPGLPVNGSGPTHTGTCPSPDFRTSPFRADYRQP